MTKSESEIWREHPEIVGIEVSTLGRVRTLDRVVSSEKMTRFIKGRILKQSNDRYGYLQAHIIIDGKHATKTVHRLIAQTFIPNPDNLPQVNHKNCNRADNRVSNLEWCDSSYNMKYREKFGEALGSSVVAVNLSTLEVSYFHSQREASRVLRVNQGNVNSVIKGRRKQTHGYWFTNADSNASDSIECKLHEIGKAELKVK